MILNELKIEKKNPEYKNVKYFNDNNDDSPKELFGWQMDAFNKCKDELYSVFIAPCGSGKSFLQIALATYDIINSNYLQKQLISVPQEHIHEGFIGGDSNHLPLEIPKYNDCVWEILAEHNFCEGTSRIQRLKDWLLTSAEELNKNFVDTGVASGVAAICSHAALVQVFDSLTEVEKKKAFKNLTLRLDEAHHIKNVYFDADDYTEEDIRLEDESNRLGRVCKYIFNSKKKNNKIHITTATFYRGDLKNILDPKVKEKFSFYHLDWNVHFNSLGIECFTFQFEEYTKDPIAQIVHNIIQEPNEKHLVVIPSSGTKWRQGEYREKAVNELIKKLIKGGVSADRILDLVTPETQKKNKEKLLAEPKNGSKDSKYDVVIICNLGREGTDWCPCSRLHNTACENSLTLAIQTLGRLFRRFEGKTNIKAIHYVKKFTLPKDECKRELFSDRINTVLLAMLVDDLVNPIIIPSIPKQNEQKEGNISRVGDCLVNYFGDKYEDVKYDIFFEGYDKIENKDKKLIYSLVEEILDKYNVEEKNRNDIRDALIVKILRYANQTLIIKGIDVSFLRENGFDKIVEKYQLNRSIWSGDCSAEDWERIREIWKESKKTPEEWVKVAEQLAEENGGILQNSKWLQQNGYHGLDTCMRNYPELFKYIKQDWKGHRSPEENVKLAEKLAKENGGILQNSKWLQQNRFAGLDNCMRNYPELFKHIKQESKRKTPEEWVKVAEKLAEENGGILQYPEWLCKNGFAGLVGYMRNNPELFKHIKQDSKKNSPEKNVELAEKLAEENGGILQYPEWLCKNGYNKIVSCMRKYPELFKHIKQDSKKNSLEDNVALAKELAEENGGILPCCSLLKQNGYAALYKYISVYPEAFKHIKKEYKGGNSPEENVELAEKLAKENGGILQNSKWLQQNGYSGLDRCIKNNYDLFKHIKQDRKRK